MLPTIIQQFFGESVLNEKYGVIKERKIMHLFTRTVRGIFLTYKLYAYYYFFLQV